MTEVLVADEPEDIPAFDPAGPEGLYLTELARLIRGQDTAGIWANRPDEALLGPFLMSREKRRRLPLLGDADPRSVERLERFHSAVGLAIERSTGMIASLVIRLHPEGWGRVVLIVGRLVVVDRAVRDVHRFGFESAAKLVEAGGTLVAEALTLIEQFPDAARA